MKAIYRYRITWNHPRLGIRTDELYCGSKMLTREQAWEEAEHLAGEDGGAVQSVVEVVMNEVARPDAKESP